jgi:CrcB protein
VTPLLFIAIAVAGGLGAAARFVLDGVVRARTNSRTTFPLGTFLINASGSLLLGLVVGLTSSQLLPETLHAIVGAGFLGGYTTFSTASFETVRLLQERRFGAAALNGVGMLVACVVLATAGLVLGSALGR